MILMTSCFLTTAMYLGPGMQQNGNTSVAGAEGRCGNASLSPELLSLDFANFFFAAFALKKNFV